ncbi:MAG: hypothetical protein ACPGQL_06250 [Thermoplasmatota archaeon]
MARRTVVLQPPPDAPRKTVVLRAGGPKPKGGGAVWRDRVIGVLGALLLLASVLLVEALPQDPVVLPQFQVTFPDEVGPPASASLVPFAEGETQVFEFPVEHANVHTLTVVVGWTDDVAASDPDRFRVRLLNPEGEQVAEKILENAAPRYNDPAGPNPDPNRPLFEALPFSERIGYAPTSRPGSTIVEAVSTSETPEEAQRRIAPDYAGDAEGTWSVEVTLLAAGDCEFNPGPLPLGIPLCGDPSAPTGDGAGDNDPGNTFSVQLFTYSHYEVSVAALQP